MTVPDSARLRLLLSSLVDESVRRDVTSFHSLSNGFFTTTLSDRLRTGIDSSDLPAEARDELALSVNRDSANPLPTLTPMHIRPGSCRKFSSSGLSYTAVQNFVAQAFLSDSETGRRPYASAGAWYPVEVFIVLFPSMVQGGPTDNVLHLLPISKRLESIGKAAERSLVTALNGSGMIDPALGGHYQGRPAFFVVYVLLLDRAIVRYRHRGYRFGLMEAGALQQCGEIAACESGLGLLNWATFGEMELGKLLGLDPGMLPVLAQLVGSK